MSQDNPEERLIDLVAGQIEDDERLIDGLGAGVLSLEDVERWQADRRRREPEFTAECQALIAQMRAQGFQRLMRRGGVRRRSTRRGGQAAWNA